MMSDAAIADARETDVVNLRSHLDVEMREVLFRSHFSKEPGLALVAVHEAADVG